MKKLHLTEFLAYAFPYPMEVKACGYLPPIGTPKLEKVGLVTQSVCIIFSRFLACVLPFRSTIGVQNFGRGRCPLLEIWRKKGFAILNIARCKRLYSGPARRWSLGEWPV